MKDFLILVLGALIALAPFTVQAQTTIRCRAPLQPGFYHAERRTVGQCFSYRPPGVLP